MQKLAIASLALVILLVSLSAYLRLDHSGIGCDPWPDCYGNIGVVEGEVTVNDAYERLLQDARQPMSWATPLHRLVASVLGLFIVALSLLSLINKRDRILAFSLLFLTVFLAWLGIYSEGLNNPAIVMGNLGGGFLMLGLLGWMVFRKPPDPAARAGTLPSLAIAALVVLSVQILTGGLTSANFAASACQTVPDCHGSWLPGNDIGAAFDLTQTRQIGESGRVLGGAERADIQKLHRLVAALTAALVIAVGIMALKTGQHYRVSATLALVIVAAEIAVGVAAILTELPIALAVAHNWLAAILLLVLLNLLAQTRSNPDAL
jgi:cytochrome c oxidase assembly protein subunit 15